MDIYLWITGGLAGAGVLTLVGIFIYLSFVLGLPTGRTWAIRGRYIMLATGFFVIIHGIGQLMRWLM